MWIIAKSDIARIRQSCLSPKRLLRYAVVAPDFEGIKTRKALILAFFIGAGHAELLDDSTIEITSTYDNGDEVILKVRQTSSTPR